MSTGADGTEDREGGDPVCWLDQTCPECGAMPSEDQGEHCWRCGTRTADEFG